MGFRAAVVVALFGLAGALSTNLSAQSRRALDPDFQISPVSPLAANDRVLYAVADDNLTLLTRAPGDLTWSPAGATCPNAVVAMTSSRSDLFVADTAGDVWSFRGQGFAFVARTGLTQIT